MKNYSLLSLAAVILTGCGQEGPLYLPDAPPPIHVEKPKEEKPKEEKPKEDKPASKPETPPKTEPETTK
jgi:predicted small lipoprotein YifL